MEAVSALVIGTVVVLLVPALVWSTVIVGLVHTMRDKTREGLKAAIRRAASSGK